ncbi:MAG: hypothetical protein PVI30_19400 [Myxococcales bacterium]|jgi:hypothetical protein
MATPRWIFDALPPSGARRGGNPAEHAFRHDLSTFVREVLQNANDQAVAMPRVSFRLDTLTGERRQRFLQALGWKTLGPHLQAAGQGRGGRALRRALQAMKQRDELRVMYVEDFGTEGLSGDESEGESNFRALCKDTLFSHKRDEAAGGSYGLGKSVLWIFSGLSTVLFESTLMQCPEDRDNPRFIGRAELPSHHVFGGASAGDFAGPGWLGLRARTGLGERAESVWGGEARSLAGALGFRAREEDEYGTSIAIVGFRDPTADEDADLERLAERTREAVSEYFWPAMHLPLRRLRVSVGQGAPTGATGRAARTRAVSAEDSAAAPFLEAWSGREAAREVLQQPGDVVVRTLPLRVPGRRARGGDGPVEGEVTLVVRLASERKPPPRAGQLAVFRGPGMVVKYWDRSRIALGMRPFHGVLIGGVARNPRKPSAEDVAVEQFLRLAEPPSHDDWVPTQQLKETYKPGYRKALEDLKASVDETLRALLQPAAMQGTRGPERLQKRFPIGKQGAVDKRQSAFHIRELSAELHADGWRFSGAIEPARPGAAWRAELRAYEVDDGGREGDPLAVAALDADGQVSIRLEGGGAILEAPAGTRRVRFSGRADAGPCLGALELEVAGRVLARDEGQGAR